MNKSFVITLLCVLPLLGACGQKHDDAQPTAEAEKKSFLSKAISSAATKASGEVRKKLREEDIELGSKDRNAPKAKITPQGDLVIDGRTIDIDDTQRAMLLEYRDQIATVAEAGAEVGLIAAEAAGDAVGAAIKGIFSGNSDDVEKKIEADVEARIKEPLQRLCGTLPPLLETQQALAESIPEFAPYRKMDQSDIDDCMKEDGMRGVRIDI
ncbi:DUF2884 family protein [Marilutibacter alkalisoli]|uniref:DUF2884 family protein n=1 Tax=Marilutibacter alkalisoli TaxID=2591633 RepID=UPI0014218823|nr:DUF2884 family protein [Lysobacter alkalisoli]